VRLAAKSGAIDVDSEPLPVDDVRSGTPRKTTLLSVMERTGIEPVTLRLANPSDSPTPPDTDGQNRRG